MVVVVTMRVRLDEGNINPKVVEAAVASITERGTRSLLSSIDAAGGAAEAEIEMVEATHFDPNHASLTFTPEAIRSHFDGCEDDVPLDGLTDEQLYQAACDHIINNSRVYDWFCETCAEIVDLAKRASD